MRLIDHRARPTVDPWPRIGRSVRLWHDATPGDVIGVRQEPDGLTYVVRWSDTGNVTRHYAKELEPA